MKKVAVLAGGFSSEKEVSDRSGANVCQALIDAGFEADVLNPANASFSFDILKNYDVVYPVMHGTFGEDGSLQGMLDYYGVPYVGCGVAASALAMDKNLTKLVFRSMGVPCAEGFSTKGLNAHQVLERLTQYPVFIKPVAEGSSVGARILHNKEEATQILPSHLKDFPNCLIETYISGREMTTGLAIYKENLIFLPILEVAPQNEFYDYHAKYTKGMSNLICPAPLPESVRAQVETHCRNIYAAFGLEGCIRVDFILQQDNSTCFLEVNTSPGMTATSDIPAMLQAQNIPVSDFCADLCLYAIKTRGHHES
ncbi:MAG: D-alanine--D-alanine ligase family protein [Brevinema sp.]